MGGCLQSVAHQKGMEHEFIIQDGGGTRNRLESLGVDLSNRNIETSPDTGMYDALNRGFARANGEIYGWLNADEQYLPGALAKVEKVFQENPSIDFVYGDYIMVRPDGTPLAARREIPARLWYLRNGVNYILSCTTFFRRRAWERWGPLDTSLQRLADKDFYLRMLEGGATCAHIKAYLALYASTFQNLSLSPKALTEQEEVRNRHSTRAGLWLRMLARACRSSEKLLRGCYGRRRLTFTFWTPSGDSLRIEDTIGTKWTD